MSGINTPIIDDPRAFETRLRKFWKRSCSAAAQGAFAGVWIRTAIVFGLLVIVKCFLLFRFREYLFESHWRINYHPLIDWTDVLGFWLFATVMALNIWRLGENCGRAGVK